MQNKIVFSEGPRNVGKTFLINKFLETHSNYQYFKFPFAQTYQECQNIFGEDLEKTMLGLTIGRDLTEMAFFKEQLLNTNLIIDRGILSTIVYGIIEKRWTEEQAKLFINSSLIPWDKLSVIFIQGINPEHRIKDEKWDKLLYKDQSETFIKTINQLGEQWGFTVKGFYNNFDVESIKRFQFKIENI